MSERGKAQHGQAFHLPSRFLLPIVGGRGGHQGGGRGWGGRGRELQFLRFYLFHDATLPVTSQAMEEVAVVVEVRCSKDKDACATLAWTWGIMDSHDMLVFDRHAPVKWQQMQAV